MEHRTKPPDGVEDYTIDWAKWLLPSEVITTSRWEVPPGLTQIGVDTKDDTSTTIRLSGGGDNRAFYSVFNHIVSDQDRKWTDGFILEVVID